MAAADAGVRAMAETFAELLKRQLDQNLLTQESAAEMTGVSVASIKRYVSGRGVPQAHNAACIASAFGIEARRVAEAIRNREEG